jgi:nitroreductase
MVRLADNIEKIRPNEYGSDDIFRNRWSPRSMTGETVDDNDLMAMFEAAHWAPSAANNQSWRFIYARRSDPEWEILFNLLNEKNRRWCKNAGALVVVVSKTTFDKSGKPSRTHSYDTGAAWGMFALQGAMRGLVVHGMEGFSYERAKSDLGVPDGYSVEAMAAVGILDDASKLPEDLAAREIPSGRKRLAQIMARGSFGEDLR